MLRTVGLAALICAWLTTPTAACTDDMAQLAQAINTPTLDGDIKRRVREVMLRAREHQTAGDIEACIRTLDQAKQILKLPVRKADEELRLVMRS